MGAIDLDYLRGWIGRARADIDLISLRQAMCWTDVLSRMPRPRIAACACRPRRGCAERAVTPAQTGTENGALDPGLRRDDG